ncbi:hypothetical protein FPF71_05540 [Algibacter amylolyticus]|uniref:DUF4468 domain-containing protein n=1 Tax=Algibacter amylolyticus TaxID=1608400 RepID=A0A5M7BD58_9FLAO|nr:hypothetical protein [Algibacter amylolyticus]KAA5826278.1 hypothetical protein F2B50_05540 [Algibacter amylolyticus]MBB5268481.1 hypothetical protein [Algibacter amylolyticus]TSJ80316.1 hypothetical protein FPF71_05540 [Algibacter amylolyticus]
MSKSIVLFLGFAFVLSTNYAQVNLELNTVNTNYLAITNTIKVKTLASNLSFNSNKLINLLNKKFGLFNEASKGKLGVTYLWKNIALKNINTEGGTLIIYDSHYDKKQEHLNGKITHIKIPIVNIYILDMNNKNILDSNKNETKMTKYFKKLIKKASKN